LSGREAIGRPDLPLNVRMHRPLSWRAPVESRRYAPNTGSPAGYDPITMTHAKPDDEQPQQPPITSATASANPAPRVSSRLALVVPVLISLVALGLASWALLRTPADTPPPPTAQQIADARGLACAAYARVRSAVALQSQADPGADPNAAQLVAVNARLAMAVGSQHIVDNLGPAVPSELAGLLRSVATDLQDLAVNALAGTSGDEAGQVARLHELEATSQKIVELCK
jgi:hypothetical protein